MLFDDWNEEEWARFDSYMINCCQYYLKNGLVSHDFNNLESRKFIKETSYEFYEWSNDDNLPINTRLYKDELFNNFINEYTDWQKMSKRRFTSWLTIYGANYGLKVFEGKTNNLRWIEFEKEGIPKTPQDVWDNIEVKTETPF
jgi:hypothetical protein